MQPKTDVWAFLIEAYQRMSLKSPKFFQVVQSIGMIAALVTGIPLAIEQLEALTGLNINLPDWLDGKVVDIIFWCGVIVKIMGKLPVIDQKAPVTPQGEIQTRAQALPFTEKIVQESKIKQS